LRAGCPRVTHPFAAKVPALPPEGFQAETPPDLHVLGTPPAFVLSQDQTLQERKLSSKPCGLVHRLLSLPKDLRPHRARFPPLRFASPKDARSQDPDGLFAVFKEQGCFVRRPIRPVPFSRRPLQYTTPDHLESRRDFFPVGRAAGARARDASLRRRDDYFSTAPCRSQAADMRRIPPAVPALRIRKNPARAYREPDWMCLSCQFAGNLFPLPPFSRRTRHPLRARRQPHRPPRRPIRRSRRCRSPAPFPARRRPRWPLRLPQIGSAAGRAR